MADAVIATWLASYASAHFLNRAVNVHFCIFLLGLGLLGIASPSRQRASKLAPYVDAVTEVQGGNAASGWKMFECKRAQQRVSNGTAVSIRVFDQFAFVHGAEIDLIEMGRKSSL